MTERSATPELMSDLDGWEVLLKTGEVITVRAHGYKERDGCYVFVALMKGDPSYEYELFRLPAAIVDDVDGGWSHPRGASA